MDAEPHVVTDLTVTERGLGVAHDALRRGAPHRVVPGEVHHLIVGTLGQAAWFSDFHVGCVAVRAFREPALLGDAELLAWVPATPGVVPALIAVPDDEAHALARSSANLSTSLPLRAGQASARSACSRCLLSRHRTWASRARCTTR